jgi:tryptophan halogenase
MTKKFVILGGGTAGLLAALMLNEKFPFSKICIVKSGEIGIIGVGEGSTEHFRNFIEFVGIDHKELIYETNATIKIGILFKDWTLGKQYCHSVGLESTISGLFKPDVFNLMLLENKTSFLNTEFEKVYMNNNVVVTDNLLPSNQFHFDTFKLNSYLIKKCLERDIKIIDTIVTDVKLDDSGNLRTLLCQDDTKISGDFFFDCSGFKRVLSSKLGVKWQDLGKYLPLNHAIAFPTEHDGDYIEPYTSCVALKNGWVWKIPTQERYGNGYVFCDKFINTDQAISEISQHLGKKVEKIGRDIKFSAGKVEKFWHKNVLSIGLSGSFLEPLEAQSIGFTILQVFEFLKCFDAYTINDNYSNVYNKVMDECFSNIVDYVQLHYITDRNDSEFWRSKCFELTDFNKYELPLLRQGIFDTFWVNYQNRMFSIPNFYQILAGLDLFDKKVIHHRMKQNRDVYNHNIQNRLEEIKNMRYNVMPHKKFLEIINFNYLNNH